MAEIFREVVFSNVAKKRSWQVADNENSPLPALLAEPTRPNVQKDWPLCMLASPPLDSDAPANRLLLLTGPAPFRQNDWEPVERRKNFKQADHPINMLSLLTSQTLPFGRGDIGRPNTSRVKFGKMAPVMDQPNNFLTGGPGGVTTTGTTNDIGDGVLGWDTLCDKDGTGYKGSRLGGPHLSKVLF